jgi:hypothetical protein
MKELAKITLETGGTLHIIKRDTPHKPFIFCWNAKMQENNTYSWDWGTYCKTYAQALSVLQSRLNGCTDYSDKYFKCINALVRALKRTYKEDGNLAHPLCEICVNYAGNNDVDCDNCAENSFISWMYDLSDLARNNK